MVLETKILTVEEFDRIALLPENADKLLEFIGGRIFDAVSDSYASVLGATMAMYLGKFVYANKLGFLTGANGGYQINGERYIPSTAFVSKARQPEPSREAYSSIPPDLAVDVISAFDKPNAIATKIVNYLLVGTTAWVVVPEEQLVTVYVANQKPKHYSIEDTLDGGAVLPDFTLPVKDIFAE